MSKTNLIILTSSYLPTIGGTEIFTECLARGLQQRGYITKVLVNRHSLTDLVDDSNPTDFQVISERNVVKILKILIGGDLLIYSQFSLFFFPLVMLSRRKNLVIHRMSALTQSRKIPLKEKLKRKICKSQRNVFVSQSLMKLVDIPGRVIHNGSPWSPLQNICVKDIDFLFVGRLIWDKGPLDAIKAYSRLDKNYVAKAPKFVFVGSGPLRDLLEAESISRGLRDNIEFLGELNPTDVRELMERAKTVVVSSTFAEPFGLVAIEALLARAIPLVSTSGGLREATRNHCISFETSDIQELSQKMELIVNEYETLYEKVFEGIDFMDFGIVKMIDQYSRIIDKILEN